MKLIIRKVYKNCLLPYSARILVCVCALKYLLIKAKVFFFHATNKKKDEAK